MEYDNFVRGLAKSTRELNAVVMPHSKNEDHGLNLHPLEQQEIVEYASEISELANILFANRLLFDPELVESFLNQETTEDLGKQAMQRLVHEQNESLKKDSQGFQFALASNEVSPTAQWGGYLFHGFQNLVADHNLNDLVSPELKAKMGNGYYPDIIADVGTVVILSQPEKFPRLSADLGSERGALQWEYFLPNSWSNGKRFKRKDRSDVRSVSDSSVRTTARHIYDILKGFKDGDEYCEYFLDRYIQQRAINTIVRRMDSDPEIVPELFRSIWRTLNAEGNMVKLERATTPRSHKNAEDNFIGSSVFWNNSRRDNKFFEFTAVYGPGYHVKWTVARKFTYFDADNSFTDLDPKKLNAEIIAGNPCMSYMNDEGIKHYFYPEENSDIINIHGTRFTITRPGDSNTVVNSGLTPGEGFRGDVWFLSLYAADKDKIDFAPDPIL